MSDNTIELDTKKLDSLIAAFKSDIPEARVGILNSKSHVGWQKNKILRSIGKLSKSGKTFKKSTNFASISTMTNAEIGAKHEFGMGGAPVRSFLRVPIAEHLMAFLKNAKAFDEEVLKKVIEEKSIKRWMKKLAATAETVVDMAFETGGWGKWLPSKMKYKKVHMTLVETQQLRKSISSEVK